MNISFSSGAFPEWHAGRRDITHYDIRLVLLHYRGYLIRFSSSRQRSYLKSSSISNWEPVMPFEGKCWALYRQMLAVTIKYQNDTSHIIRQFNGNNNYYHKEWFKAFNGQEQVSAINFVWQGRCSRCMIITVWTGNVLCKHFFAGTCFLCKQQLQVATTLLPEWVASTCRW